MAQEKSRTEQAAEAEKPNQNDEFQSFAFHFLLAMASVQLGFVISMLCSVAATIGTIAASLIFVPLFVAGEFISIFIAFVAAIYVIPFAVTAAIVLPVVAPIITIGWMGVVYSIWMGTRKLAKKLWNMTDSVSDSILSKIEENQR